MCNLNMLQNTSIAGREKMLEDSHLARVWVEAHTTKQPDDLKLGESKLHALTHVPVLFPMALPSRASLLI